MISATLLRHVHRHFVPAAHDHDCFCFVVCSAKKAKTVKSKKADKSKKTAKETDSKATP